MLLLFYCLVFLVVSALEIVTILFNSVHNSAFEVEKMAGKITKIVKVTYIILIYYEYFLFCVTLLQ